jgi:uncharacterized protein YbcI
VVNRPYSGSQFFLSLSEQQLEELHKRIHKAWAKVFGKHNLGYNVHMFTHMELVRAKGVVTETSAFLAEASYKNFREK